MTIGNLSSKISQIPSMHSLIMVALLPIPINNRNWPQNRLEERQQTNREVLNEVLQQMIPRHTFKHNPGNKSGYYNVLCSDDNFTHCKLV
jgi:hypothetical protein